MPLQRDGLVSIPLGANFVPEQQQQLLGHSFVVATYYVVTLVVSTVPGHVSGSCPSPRVGHAHVALLARSQH